MLLNKFLSLPNKKALILKKSFYSVVYETLLVHKFKFVPLDTKTDFAVYDPKTRKFIKKHSSVEYIFLFQ